MLLLIKNEELSYSSRDWRSKGQHFMPYHNRNPFSTGRDFKRQNVTSIDATF